jgi:hypothetical protein
MSFASDLIPIRNHKRAQADVLLPSQAWLGAAVTFTIAHATGSDFEEAASSSGYDYGTGIR